MVKLPPDPDEEPLFPDVRVMSPPLPEKPPVPVVRVKLPPAPDALPLPVFRVSPPPTPFVAVAFLPLIRKVPATVAPVGARVSMVVVAPAGPTVRVFDPVV
jgi:hypothetical protein